MSIPWITIFLTAIIAGIGYLLRVEIEKRRETEKQLSEKKYQVYTSIISMFFSVFNSVRKKDNADATTDEMADKMVKIVEELIIYGSDSVLRTFSNWKMSAADGISVEMQIILLTNVMIEIRKDMGHPNTKMTMDDIWGPSITDYPTFKKQILEAVAKP